MKGIWRRLRILWATAIVFLVPALVLFYMQPWTTKLFNGLFVIMVGLWWILVIAYTLYTIFSFRLAPAVDPASGFIEKITKNPVEYCLLLRPFGADGHVPIKTSCEPGSQRAVFFAYVKTSKTLESIIESTVKEVLNCETIALVDPQLKILTTSPTYISADSESWKEVVDILLKRALIVVLVLAPGQTIRESVGWEIFRAIEVGLLGRLIIVLPPPNVDGHEKAHKALLELNNLIPGVSSCQLSTIVVYPSCYEEVQWSYLDSTKATEENYRKAILEVLHTIKMQLEGLRFGERYLYWKVNNNLSGFAKSNLKPRKKSKILRFKDRKK